MPNLCCNRTVIQSDPDTIRMLLIRAGAKTGEDRFTLVINRLVPESAFSHVEEQGFTDLLFFNEKKEAIADFREISGGIELFFDSMIDSPIEFIAEVAKQTPKLTIEHYYCEISLGFAGKLKASNGEITLDESFSVGEENSEALLTLESFQQYVESIGFHSN